MEAVVSTKPPQAGRRLATRLLSHAFEDVDPSRPLTVLDVGAATPESVRFFNRFRCRLFYLDIFNETGYHNNQAERRRAGETAFDRIFDFPKDTLFDICLFWDFLNYLSTPLVRELARTLSNHVHRETRGHAFGPFSEALPFAGLRFGLADLDSLVIRSEPSKVPHAHTFKSIKQTFWPFTISRATLLEENRQELLLGIDTS